MTDGNVEAGKSEIITDRAAIKLNLEYFKTIPGILKLAELFFGILCMACAKTALNMEGTGWFLFFVIISFIATICWLFMYLFSIREALKLPINWLLTEFYNTGILTLFYTVGFIIQLAIWSDSYYVHIRGQNIAAGVFGLFNTLVYGFATYLLYVEWKAAV